MDDKQKEIVLQAIDAVLASHKEMVEGNERMQKGLVNFTESLERLAEALRGGKQAVN